MTTEPATLHGVAATTLITVYLRAEDAASRHPILGDPYAAGVLEKVDHDFSLIALGRGNAPLIAARGAQLDRWTREFLAAHPDGQVLHLGCGLDSRPLRLDRPAGSRWIDVDQPEVVDLRRRVYDLPPEITTIGASVTDPGWWDQVDTDRPTLIVAEGLLMYLPGDEVHALIDRARARLAHAEIAFDGAAGWLVWLTRHVPFVQRFGALFSWALEDLARSHPGATTLADVSVIGLLTTAPLGAVPRAAYRLLDDVPGMRDALRLQYVRLHGAPIDGG